MDVLQIKFHHSFFCHFILQVVFDVHIFLCSSSRSIEDLLNKWGLKGVQIPLKDFDANHGNIGGSNISDLHTIQMLEITRQ